MRSIASLATLASTLLAGCGTAPTDKPMPAASPTAVGRYDQQQCGGVPRGWARQGVESAELVEYNRIRIGAKELSWNGAAIDASTLSAYLVQIAQMSPEPITVLVIAPDAGCAAVASTRNAMEKALGCAQAPSHCVEYDLATWDKVHARVPAPPGNETGE
jgi:uncharacterized protein YceK